MRMRSIAQRAAFPNLVPDNVSPEATEDDTWMLRECRNNPSLWDYHDEDGETWREQQARHEIVVSICLTCPALALCERDLAAQTEPMSGVIAGQVLSGNGGAGSIRLDRPATLTRAQVARKSLP